MFAKLEPSAVLALPVSTPPVLEPNEPLPALPGLPGLSGEGPEEGPTGKSPPGRSSVLVAFDVNSIFGTGLGPPVPCRSSLPGAGVPVMPATIDTKVSDGATPVCGCSAGVSAAPGESVSPGAGGASASGAACRKRPVASPGLSNGIRAEASTWPPSGISVRMPRLAATEASASVCKWFSVTPLSTSELKFAYPGSNSPGNSC